MFEIDEDWSWDNYFKNCGIYQGRSHWTDLYDLIKKLIKK